MFYNNYNVSNKHFKPIISAYKKSLIVFSYLKISLNRFACNYLNHKLISKYLNLYFRKLAIFSELMLNKKWFLGRKFEQGVLVGFMLVLYCFSNHTFLILFMLIFKTVNNVLPLVKVVFFVSVCFLLV